MQFPKVLIIIRNKKKKKKIFDVFLLTRNLHQQPSCNDKVKEAFRCLLSPGYSQCMPIGSPHLRLYQVAVWGGWKLTFHTAAALYMPQKATVREMKLVPGTIFHKLLHSNGFWWRTFETELDDAVNYSTIYKDGNKSAIHKGCFQEWHLPFVCTFPNGSSSGSQIISK